MQNAQKSKRIAMVFLLFIMALGLCQSWYYYTVLPDKVALHFDFRGAPDRWDSKAVLLMINSLLFLGLGGMFLLLSRISRKIPDTILNLPNKSYWLAPERRDMTFHKYAKYLLWFGVFTLLFLFFLFRDVYRFNLTGSMEDKPVVWLNLISYSVVSIIWLVFFYRSFRIPKGSA